MEEVLLHNVSKIFGTAKKPALNNLSFSLSTGKITGLVGPDGAGKTTLMRLLTGLLSPTKGEIRIYGYDPVTQGSEVQNLLGYMPQKFGLYEDLSVLENMVLYAKLKNIPQAKMALTFEKMFYFTALGEFKDRLAGRLSGGMKQKLGLACAVMGDPKLLLLDEPSVGVDPISRRELWQMVREIASQDIVVVWSTAYLDEAEKCDHVFLLNEGEVLYQGIPSDLTNTIQGRVFTVRPPASHRHEVLESLLPHEGLVDGLIQGDRLRLVLQTPEAVTKLPLAADVRDTLEETSPRFEDAFIALLKRNRSEPIPTESILAKRMDLKESFKEPPIEARGLTKQFGEFVAARDINFSVRQGEIFGLLGPNGAGKSTTFKMLCSLLTPTHGEALVLGRNLKNSTSLVRTRIGYMAQKFSLYGDLSVVQNLRFFAGVYGLKETAQEKINEIIDIFEFEPYVNTTAGLLPLGYKQRLALACAVMHEPDILFLDEPTSGVDPLTRREFWLHINQMVQKGMTIMVTTHFMDEAENCDRIALIYRGKNIAMGTPDDLKELIKGKSYPSPTLEDAFIELVLRVDGKGEIDNHERVGE